MRTQMRGVAPIYTRKNKKAKSDGLNRRLKETYISPKFGDKETAYISIYIYVNIDTLKVSILTV